MRVVRRSFICRGAAHSGAATRMGRVPTGAPVSRSMVTGSISVPVSASKNRVTLPPPRCLRPHAPIANSTGKKSRPASVSTYSSRGGRSGRLSALTDEGLVEKRRYSDRPPRDEYVLTEAGRDFLPVLFAIGAWGRKHRGGGKVTRFFDADTGTEIDPVTIDRETGAPVGTRPIRVAAPE